MSLNLPVEGPEQEEWRGLRIPEYATKQSGLADYDIQA